MKDGLNVLEKKLAWITDYQVIGIDQSENLIKYFVLFSDCDPTVFKEAIKI